MFVSDNLGVNASGNLTIGGVDTVALAKKYGTPLYVMDEDMIRRDWVWSAMPARHFPARRSIA